MNCIHRINNRGGIVVDKYEAPRIHQCECGYSWIAGEHGGHACSPYYLRTIDELRSRVAQEVSRQEMLAEVIGKIAYDLNIIDGTIPMTGPQVLMIGEDCLEGIKHLRGEVSDG